MKTFRMWQEQIQEQLTTQIELCQEALPIAEELAKNYDHSESRQTLLFRLEELMQSILEEQMLLSKLVNRVEHLDYRTTMIRESSSCLATLMSKLIDCFGQIEKHALAVKNRLYPNIEETTRARKMLDAYSRSANELSAG